MKARAKLNPQTKRFKQMSMKTECAADEVLLRDIFELLARKIDGAEIEIRVPIDGGKSIKTSVWKQEREKSDAKQ